MAESRFVYVTYIRTTPEKLWRALLDPEFTRRYFVGTWQECAWEAGAPWRMMTPDGQTFNSGRVLEIEPNRRLVLSWRHDTDQFPGVREEGYSRCTFELEAQGSSVRLTVIHEMDRPDSEHIRIAASGWPLVLSSLKSLLETGEPLEETRHRPKGQ